MYLYMFYVCITVCFVLFEFCDLQVFKTMYTTNSKWPIKLSLSLSAFSSWSWWALLNTERQRHKTWLESSACVMRVCAKAPTDVRMEQSDLSKKLWAKTSFWTQKSMRIHGNLMHISPQMGQTPKHFRTGSGMHFLVNKCEMAFRRVNDNGCKHVCRSTPCMGGHIVVARYVILLQLFISVSKSFFPVAGLYSIKYIYDTPRYGRMATVLVEDSVHLPWHCWPGVVGHWLIPDFFQDRDTDAYHFLCLFSFYEDAWGSG